MTDTFRQLGSVLQGQPTSDGAGVKLKRIVSPQQKQAFDPFILLDEFASEHAGDYIAGFPEHPHRGFETVTYMLAGAMLHRDHLGNEGHLRPGGVQWMTAGRGIIHSEMPEQENGLLRGFQLWINLPAREKMTQPRYQEFSAEQIPAFELADGGTLKVIAGDFALNGQHLAGAVKGISTAPLYLDIALAKAQTLVIPVPPQHTVLVYVYDGTLAVDTGRQPLNAGQLGHMLKGDAIRLAAQDQPARCLLIAAAPLHEPVVQSGPFVMNTHEEIEQAYRDYRDGVLAQ
ncbi:MAG: quercetin 2,3-dioxygenase [Methylobacter sp.]|nr:MAG: quercetin 2,3-dioxygenase [Methylobacter sp.]